MARRRRKVRRRRSTSGRFVSRGTSTRKRRRRRHAVAVARPVRRRRRHAVAGVTRRRRRHFRRNPATVRGATNLLMQGVKDGGAVFVGQVAGRKIGAGLNAMLPATLLQSSPAVRGILSRTAGAVVVTIAARKLLPGYAKLVAAGAFSEVIGFAISQNATASSFLSAYTRRVVPPPVVRGVAAWTRPAAVASGGVRAYPRSVGMPTMAG